MTADENEFVANAELRRAIEAAQERLADPSLPDDYRADLARAIALARMRADGHEID